MDNQQLEQLMADYYAGSNFAGDEIERNTRYRILGFLLSLLRRGSADPRIYVEDLTQQTWVQVFRTRDSRYSSGRYQPGPKRTVIHWLLRIAQNVLTDFRRHRNIPTLPGDDSAFQNGESHEESPEARIMRDEVARRVHEAVQALPERRREVMRLYLTGLPPPDIAARLGMALGTVHATMHDARQELHQTLGDLSDFGE